MATTALARDDAEKVITRGGIRLMNFSAIWCGPCRSFAPVFERPSEQHPGSVLGGTDPEAETPGSGYLRVSADKGDLGRDPGVGTDLDVPRTELAATAMSDVAQLRPWKRPATSSLK